MNISILKISYLSCFLLLALCNSCINEKNHINELPKYDRAVDSCTNGKASKSIACDVEHEYSVAESCMHQVKRGKTFDYEEGNFQNEKEFFFRTPKMKFWSRIDSLELQKLIRLLDGATEDTSGRRGSSMPVAMWIGKKDAESQKIDLVMNFLGVGRVFYFEGVMYRVDPAKQNNVIQQLDYIKSPTSATNHSKEDAGVPK